MNTCDDSQPLSHVPSGSLQLFGTLCVPSAAYPRSAKVRGKEKTKGRKGRRSVVVNSVAHTRDAFGDQSLCGGHVRIPGIEVVAASRTPAAQQMPRPQCHRRCHRPSLPLRSSEPQGGPTSLRPHPHHSCRRRGPRHRTCFVRRAQSPNLERRTRKSAPGILVNAGR